MLNSKLVISLSKSSFLALKIIIFLIDLRSRDLDQNVKMSDQSNAQLLVYVGQRKIQTGEGKAGNWVAYVLSSLI